jgi:hypothetical protein
MEKSGNVSHATTIKVKKGWLNPINHFLKRILRLHF